MELINWSPDYFIANRSSCEEILKNIDYASCEIPSLNGAPLHKFKDKQLVRFCGMIQDTYNPEYYYERYEVKNTQTGVNDIRCGMFTDLLEYETHEELLPQSSNTKNSQRQVCVVISIPGLNDWAKEDNISVTDIRDTSNPSKSKRHLDEVEPMECCEPMQKKEKTALACDKADADEKASNCDASHNASSLEHTLNFPIPIHDGKSCIVKVYSEEQILKINQIVQIIGFISLSPALANIYDSDEVCEAEMKTHNPPASLIPRLHAIRVTQFSENVIENPELISKAAMIRSDLHLIFSQLFFADELAADYLICHLLSSVYSRNEYYCLGNFPINITHFPLQKFDTFPKDLYAFLELLIRKSHYLQMSLENLNVSDLIPRKDYECDRLTSGTLQLSKNTHLIIDETALRTGQVTQKGRENYNAISDLIRFQKVKYDFKYYTVEYETDIPVLILSEAKSFFPCPTQIALKSDVTSEQTFPQVLEAAKQYLKDQNRLNNIRQYLEVVKNIEFKLDDDISNTIQQDFVTLRQTNKNITADNLHSLIVLARLQSLSYGKNVLTHDHWKKTVEMEMERMSRLPRSYK